MTTWLREERTAKVWHVCEMCRRVIESGERYIRGTGFDGTAWSWNECRHCQALVLLIDVMDYYDDNSYSEDSIREYEPRNFTEARWLCYWRRRWQRQDGSLYEVPRETIVPL